MKLNICQSDDLFIVGRTERDTNWLINIEDIEQPSTIFFIVSGIPENFDTIKKIVWNFDNDARLFTVTNRKHQPEKTVVKHTFKKIDVETLTIQASVYTSKDLFISSITIGPFKDKVKKNYIDPVVFSEQIVNFYGDKNLTDDLALSVQKIATRLAFAPNFINYTYREEMVGDAVVKMIKALREEKFNPKKGNPFSYFTKIAFHAFCNRIKKEKKTKETLTEYQDEVFFTLSESGYIPQSKKCSEENEFENI